MKNILNKIKQFKIVKWFLKFFKTYQVFTEAEPFVVQYTNETDKVQDAILFGYNGFLKDNFGNPNLTVTSLNEGVYYAQTLRQSDTKNFWIGKVRIMSKDMRWYYDKSISYRLIDANGKEITIPTVIVNHIDAYQQQQDIIDIRRFDNYEINGNTHFSFKVKENSTFVISVFPLFARKVNYWAYKRAQKEERKELLKKSVIIYANFSFKEWFKAWFKGLFKK